MIVTSLTETRPVWMWNPSKYFQNWTSTWWRSGLVAPVPEIEQYDWYTEKSQENEREQKLEQVSHEE